MKDLMNKISGSKFFKEMKKIFVSIKENENVKNVINGLSNSADNATIPNPFDTFGHYASEKIKKLFKRFGKKFKNEEKAVNVMTKIISVITKVVCVGLSLAFLVLVAYVLIKLLPKIIMACAIFAALYIGVGLTTAILSRGIGVNAN